MPARSIRIFLVRHGESEANLDKSVNIRLPDHSIALSPQGHAQALQAGERLASVLRGSRARIFASPYLRARQTAEGIERALAAAKIEFDRREAIELRELEFGLFDGIADEDLPKVHPREYQHYEKYKRFAGEFFAPMPLGESHCNVADRVKGVFGTILRYASPDRPHPVLDFVIVSHGVTVRCFRMQWMHYSWEWYEREKNPLNCSVQLIESRQDGGYDDRRVFDGFAQTKRTLQHRREEGHVG
ncbi:MAG: histidine phosphatase family protein [Hyphomicrobiales bacterium]